MSVIIQGNELRTLLFGEKVDRATAALPQATAAPIFTVAVGRVLITSIVGEVTTAIQVQINNTKLVGNPTTGTSNNMCAPLDITGDAVADLYSISGVATDVLIGAGAGSIQAMLAPMVVAVGAIDLDCSASSTGSVKWSITYVPLDNGAFVSAA